MPPLQIDTSINVSDLLVFLGGLWAFITMFSRMRDTMRDLVAETKALRTDLSAVVEDLNALVERYDRHHEWLIQLRAKVGTD